MSLLLNKVLPIPLLPIGACLLLCLLGWHRRRRAPVVAGLLLLLVFSLPATSRVLFGSLEAVYPRIEPAESRQADAIVVLGGYLRQLPGTSAEHPEWNEASERFWRGIDLLRAGRAPLVVFPGGLLPWEAEGRLPEGELAAKIARLAGVPGESILVTGAVGNTQGEAREIARLCEERGWRRVILVTSAFHLPRADEQFERAGVDTLPFPCDWRTNPEDPLDLLDFVPSAEALHLNETALREYYGRLFYAVQSVWRAESDSP